MTTAHWHVRLRWRAGNGERVVDADLAYQPSDNVMFVLSTAARLNGVPLASVRTVECNLVTATEGGAR